MRPGALAAVSLVAAVLGGASALAIASAAGWVGGDTRTVFVATPAPANDDTAAPVARSVAKPIPGDEFDPSRIYAERAAGVVTIYAHFGDEDSPAGAAQGSGFVVSPRGYILTNSHVIAEADGPDEKMTPASSVFVEFADRDRVPAKIVGWDPFDDVGVIRVDPKAHDLTPLPLGDSSQVVVGEPVAAIGSPFGNVSSLVVGVVSATRRSIASLTSDYNVVDAIQTDAPINRGNSGGPLFDARGRVIGINAQIRSDTGVNEGVGFAIPINAARRSMTQLVRGGRVRYAYVGIETADLTPSLADRFGYRVGYGAVITGVRGNSGAARAGLRAGNEEKLVNGERFEVGGDVIVAIDGERVRSADDVVRIVTERLLPGHVAAFTVVRNGVRRTIPVRLGERATPGTENG